MNSNVYYLLIMLICTVLIIIIQQFSIWELEKKTKEISEDLVETKLKTIVAFKAFKELKDSINNKN